MGGNRSYLSKDRSVLECPEGKYVVLLFRRWANAKVIHEMTIYLTHHFIRQSMVIDKKKNNIPILKR